MAKEEIAPAGAISSFVKCFQMSSAAADERKNGYLWSKGLRVFLFSYSPISF